MEYASSAPPSTKITFCSSLKKEFQWSNFKLDYHRYDVFTQPLWSWPSMLYIYLLWRISAPIYLIGWAINSVITNAIVFGHLWPAYLTNWNYTLMCIYFCTAFATVFQRITKEKKLKFYMALPCDCHDAQSINKQYDNVKFTSPSTCDQCKSMKSQCKDETMMDVNEELFSKDCLNCKKSDGISNYEIETIQISVNSDITDGSFLKNYKHELACKIQWALFTTVSLSSLFICMAYYIFIYPEISDGGPPNAIDLHVHGVIAIFTSVEILIIAYPIRLYHFFYPVILGLFYLIFNTIYYFGMPEGNRVVYREIIDWNQPLKTIFIQLLASFIILPTFQMCVYIMNYWKIILLKNVLK